MANRQAQAIRPTSRGDVDAGLIAGISDGQLLSRFAANRDELGELAFAALLHRHGPLVWRVCRQVLADRHTAEDAFQATFLVLARRAGSIRQPELLGHWLYGVALRTAREARMRDQRRRQRETSGVDTWGADAVGELGQPELPLVCREELEALHEELGRLPERYRVPVVLCDLQGLTHEEAARRLRCPLGTIGVRLRRARLRLRERLSRRGLAPSAALLGGLLAAEAVSAWTPPVLIESTLEAATRFAASETAAVGVVSAPVAALTEAVLRSLAFSRRRITSSLMLVAGLTASVGWIGLGGHAGAPIFATAPQPQPQHRPAGAAPQPGPPATAADQPRAATNMPVVVFRSKVIAEGESVNAAADQAPARAPETPQPVAAQLRRGPRDETVWGETLFAKEWGPHDRLSRGGDGLGPVYNESSCMACHGLGAPGGAGPESKNVVLASIAANPGFPAKNFEKVHPGFRNVRSTVLHRYGTDPEYRSWRRHFYETKQEEQQAQANEHETDDPIEAQVKKLKQEITRARRGAGARSPTIIRRTNEYTLTLSERNTPPLFGAGRIDSIPAGVLVALAQEQPKAIRGRVNRTPDGQIGRFGWKAQVASLHAFVRAACANELGLEVPGHAQAVSPLAPAAKAPGLDLTERDCDALVSYVRSLPAPMVIDPSGPRGTRDMSDGRELFMAVGCAGCHVPTLGEVQGIYSDLLLHNMGPWLNDSGSYYGSEDPTSPGNVSPQEWRTPPLWGYRDSGPYLHDGRAENLEEAVALHDGQAAGSARAFFELPPEDRARIETFLKSLIAPTSARLPGVVLAADMESRIERQERRFPESVVRRRREETVAREQQRWREIMEERRHDEAARRARVQLPAARDLEKMGKIAQAIDFYRKIASQAANTPEGRLAAERIEALRTRFGTP